MLPTVSTTSTPWSPGDLDGGVGAVVGDDQHPVRRSGLLLQRAQRPPRTRSSLCAGISTVHRTDRAASARAGTADAGHGGGDSTETPARAPTSLRAGRRTLAAAPAGGGPVRALSSPPRSPAPRRPDRWPPPRRTSQGQPEPPLRVVEQQDRVGCRDVLFRDEGPHGKAQHHQREHRQDGWAQPSLAARRLQLSCGTRPLDATPRRRCPSSALSVRGSDEGGPGRSLQASG